VTIDSYDPSLGAFGLIPDYRSGVREATSRLLAAGHRRIALICGALNGATSGSSLQFTDQVVAGCLEAHEAAGVKPPEWLPAKVCDGSPASGYEFGKAMLADPQNRPDAVIGSDGALLGVIRAAWELGLRIPQDVSLVGTDGVSMGAYFTPPLTAVDVQIARLGEIATRIVVEGASRQEFRQGVEVTPVRFVERASARLGSKG
jgi:DNA-binding LacI/PurR family transcriptional regulator